MLNNRIQVLILTIIAALSGDTEATPTNGSRRPGLGKTLSLSPAQGYTATSLFP
jgi:hypothetical protein